MKMTQKLGTGLFSGLAGNTICALAGVTVVLAFGYGVAASASTPATSSPVIHACVANTAGAVKIVGGGASCGSTATPLNWSVRGLTFRGAYAPATAYKVNDVVTDGGSAWIAVSTSTGSTPGASPAWSLFSSAGRNGSQGSIGNQGIKGENGPAGNVTIQSGYHDAPVDVGLASEVIPIVQMTIQHPGSYIVFAKFTAFDVTNSGDDFQCDLRAGGDSDESWTGMLPTNPDYRSMELNVVHTFSGTDDKVVLACDDWSDNTTGEIRNIKITAISVNTLMNSYSGS